MQNIIRNEKSSTENHKTNSIWIQTIEDFLSVLTLSKSQATVTAYKCDINAFVSFLQSKGIRRSEKVTASHITGYLSQCKLQGKSDSTINRYFMAIKALFQYLLRNGVIQSDITAFIDTPKSSLKAPVIPTLEQMQLILSTPDTTKQLGLRDRAILELLYSSGLRVSELCDLELSDFQERSILVKCGKGSKTRSVPVTRTAQEYIQKYIEQYRGNEDGYLFLTVNARQLQRGRLSEMVSTYADLCGLKDVTTHTLRHACATHLLDHGADIRMIQEVLGHASIATTQRYTHLSSNKIHAMFESFHPRK